MRKTLVIMAVLAAFLLSSASLISAMVTEEQINDAIDKGVEWLAGQQQADGRWGFDWYIVGKTGLAVVKLAEHAVDWRYGHGLPSPFDPAYPYHEHVEKGLDYLFANAQVIPINAEPAGDPDTNGNGTGVCFGFGDWEETYCTSIAMMAIATSRAPSRVVAVAGSPVDTWTYEDVLQDAVDYLAWGQTDTGDGRGGWWYQKSDDVGTSSDNSNAGWATFGLLFAESPPYGFGCTIPDFVKSELNIWIDYIQDGSGGSGYTMPGDWVNILKTGHLLNEMALVGDTAATPRVQSAVAYLVAHWDDPNNEPGWRGSPTNYHATLNVMKGLVGLGIHEIDDIDWQYDFEEAIVPEQLADGSWPPSYWDDGEKILSTEWALLTLQKLAPLPRVEIDIKPGSYPNSIDPGSKGVIPVAILTTSIAAGETIDFDATQVDADTVRFGPNQASKVHKKAHPEDVDNDGDIDMVFHFKTQETGIMAGDTEATLTGETLGGMKFYGTDSVRTVPELTAAATQSAFGLSQNYPNPFNPTTTIEYGLDEDADVTLKIYNLAGQVIKTLVDEYQTAGRHTITWYGDTDAGGEVASGVYFYRLQAGDEAAMKKMAVLK